MIKPRNMDRGFFFFRSIEGKRKAAPPAVMNNYNFAARLRRTYFWILPVDVLGSSSKTMVLGTL